MNGGNSDVDASLYWLGRMLASGEDPMYIARRVTRMAVEDIGLASPQALGITMAARDAYDFLGTPEGELALAQAVAYEIALSSGVSLRRKRGNSSSERSRSTVRACGRRFTARVM